MKTELEHLRFQKLFDWKPFWWVIRRSGGDYLGHVSPCEKTVKFYPHKPVTHNPLGEEELLEIATFIHELKAEEETP